MNLTYRPIYWGIINKSKRGFPFNLFMINIDEPDLEQITFDDTFDSFAMFSPYGEKLVWRFNGETRDTNLIYSRLGGLISRPEW